MIHQIIKLKGHYLQEQNKIGIRLMKDELGEKIMTKLVGLRLRRKFLLSR